MDFIKGIITPIITPMDEKENINFDEYSNQIERLIKAGIHGIFTLGTNGEGYILSMDEKKKMLEKTVEIVNSRVPVYAGSGCISTKDTIELSLYAQQAGADVLSIITPSFAKASQEEIYQHYKAISQKVTIPIILYNIPGRTGNDLKPETVARLAQIDTIIGIKDSSGNFDLMLKYIEATRQYNFSVLSGNDSLILWNLYAGGCGAVAGCSNVYPENMVAIYENFILGDFEAARKAQDAIRSLRNVFEYGNPNTIVKTAIKLLGYPVGECRKPFNSLSDQGMILLQKVLNENKTIGLR